MNQFLIVEINLCREIVDTHLIKLRPQAAVIFTTSVILHHFGGADLKIDDLVHLTADVEVASSEDFEDSLTIHLDL